ncbi:MAG: phosphoglycerate kinase [Candidatus Woesearchaeota archaeon]
MALLTLRDIDFTAKRVLVRVDYNVPLDAKGRIADDTRIKASIPTLQALLNAKAKVILLSHLGRPEGRVVEGLRTDKIAKRLATLLRRPVKKFDDCIGEKVADVAKLKPGEVALLENVRFHKEEEANEHEFAKGLASLAEVYVNDAFGTMHRRHASVVGIPLFLPGCIGLLAEREIKELSALLKRPKRPFISLLGGAKVGEKIGMIKALLKRADALLIGGAMAVTFLKAIGWRVGSSLFDADKLELARALLTKSKKILLPVDFVVAKKIKSGFGKKAVVSTASKGVERGWACLDIGPETARIYGEVLKKAKTIFWNGPMGLVEEARFAKGTVILAKVIAGLKGKGMKSVVGGGETVSLIEKLKLEKKFSHVSTGGGATLEFLEGKKLPGISALEASARAFKSMLKQL